jgi:2-polyprenyl-3-methyl-5-hydroxy-6-metoxy-1,4-benzoquinol methylase
MQREGIYRILSIPKVYSFIQWLFYHSRTDSYFHELIGVTEEKKILDIDCGPGDNILKFPNSKYVGIDISQEYIDSANNKFGMLGKFYCVSVDEIEKTDITKIDIVIIKGVLHHLSDEQISGMLKK